MKFTVPVAPALAGTVIAQNSTLATSTTAGSSTTIVSALTTVCDTATVLTQNGNYYTCIEAMTLTITDCPCTMTHPSSIPTAPATYAPSPADTATAITTIIVPGVCPTTTSAPSPLEQSQASQAAGYASSCQASGAGAGAGAGYVASSQAIGTAMLPVSTQQGYLYTNGAGTAGATAAVAALAGSAAVLCALWL